VTVNLNQIIHEESTGCDLSHAYQTLSLWTTDKQKEARELYKRVGFSLVSQSPNYSFAKGLYDCLLEYGDMSNLPVGIEICIVVLVDFGFTDCGYL
jgi:hypothetical protein